MVTNDSRSSKPCLADAKNAIQKSQWSTARHICQEILSRQPEQKEAIELLAIIYQNSGEYNKAIDLYNSALQYSDGDSDILNNLGTLYEVTGDNGRAISCYRLAAENDRLNASARYNLGRMHRKSGHLAVAIDNLAAARKLAPDNGSILLELGISLRAHGRNNEALGYLLRARELEPGNAIIHNALGNTFQSLGELKHAVDCYRDAIRLQPDFSDVYNNMGTACLAMGDVPAAQVNYRQALKIRPDWQGAASNLLLSENYLSDDPASIFIQHKHWGQSLETTPARSDATVSCEICRKIRIGYVSPDFRAHSVACFIQSLFQHHDKSAFDVFCFSDVASPDNLTHELRASVTGWENIYGLPNDDVIRLILDRKIDILVDLAGHTAHNRLGVFAVQAAPVQVTYLGYPNTTGLSTIQYRLTDTWADPPGDSDLYHTEKLIRIPGGFLCYLPTPGYPDCAELPADRNHFITYGSFNVLAKISDSCIATWSAVLNQNVDAVLILKSAGLQDRSAREHILRRFDDHGVVPDRISLADRTADFRSHMLYYNRIDISLDTFPYNGTATTCESLWMGVPVITLAGNRHAGRVGNSILNQTGLGNLVAASREHYVALAGKLAENVDQLRTLRQTLRTRVAASPLGDGARLARSMEKTFSGMCGAADPASSDN